MNGVQTRGLLSDFAQPLRRKYADVSNIYISFFHAAGLSRTMVLNQKSQNQSEKNLGLFQNVSVEICEDFTQMAMLLMGLCSF